jgi:preprotein translocase subunit YajC
MESLGGLLFPLLILLLFIPIFLSGRKQRRQMQEQQQLQSALEVGDVVTTTSGLRGTVVDASYEDTIDLEIADGVVTTWLRAAVRERVLDSSGSDAPTSEIPAAEDTSSATPPSGTPVVGADQPGLDGPVGTGARTDGETTPAVDAPRDANGSSRP